ncbi:MAG: M24 family metallopeptidase C-terminal domain-containing protein, partial [Pseudomonadota bacterium]
FDTIIPGFSATIVSNEPGYYRTDAYGIRLENLVIVREPARPEGGDIDVLSFETLTLAPFDLNLIDADLLSDDERSWLDSYHAQVFKLLSPDLSAADRKWLKAACAKVLG